MTTLTLDALKTLLIISILSILGLNIFLYLVKGTDIFNSGIFSLPKGVIDTTSDTIQKTTDKIGDITDKGTKEAKNIVIKELDKIGEVLDIKLKHKKIIDDANNSQIEEGNDNVFNDLNKSHRKRGVSGYCYIGTDNDVRTCVNIGRNDICMSGDIYPSMDICINPNLRM